MSGAPEKCLEYILETRIDAQSDDHLLDTFLEDFILTHIIYIPANLMCNYLKNYYAKRGDMVNQQKPPLFISRVSGSSFCQ
jgi:hypothetical protein